MKVCSFEGCGGKVRNHGLCNRHNMQRLAGLELRPIQTQYHGLTEEQRFLKWVAVKSANECWEWLGSLNQEGWHGQWRSKDGRIELTHRASWRLFKSEIPGGLFVLHRCDNPKCVNPTHLFLGNQTDNMADMYRKGRDRQGVSKGEEHGMSKLTSDAVLEIRTSNESGVVLARKFGITPTTVCDVRKRRIWKHIH
jgi:hypothetical protein